MRRREFLSAAGAAAMAAEPLRVALVVEPEGDHLTHYYRAGRCTGLADLAIAGATDAMLAAARKEAQRDLRVFATRTALLREFRPALTIITLEPRRMPAAIREAVDAGSHVLVEKPGCATLAEFEAAADAARRADREIMLAMATRLDPAAVKARGLIASGALGRGFGADMAWIADQTRLRSDAYQASWKASRSRGGGGKLIFHGIHYIDLIRHWTGSRVDRAVALRRNVGMQPKDPADAAEDSVAAAMTLANGMAVTLHAGYYLDRGYHNWIRYWGEKGWLHFDPRSATPLTWTIEGKAGEWRAADPRPDPYALMLQSAVDFARGSAPPFITTAESLDALRAVFAAYQY